MNANKNEIATWAERTIAAEAFYMTPSLSNKRGGNPYIYNDAAVAQQYFTDLTVEEFMAARDAYIVANPMKFAATTKRLTYIVKAAA